MSDKIIELTDDEFAAQMQGLAQAATEALEVRAAATRPANEERPKASRPEKPEREAAPAETPDRGPKGYQSLPEMLRPLVDGFKAMGRTAGEHTQILNRLDKLTTESSDAQTQLPQIVADLQSLADQKNAVSRQMFDALHEELRSYKDGFLLDTVHRPMIRDLISLYDDLMEIHRQMNQAVAEQARIADGGGPPALAFLERLKGVDMHIEHNIDFVIEVLARLEVSQLPIGEGKLDKQTQRAVTVEIAEDPEADMNIVRIYKRGFLWKGRVLRAEEVAIKKWKDGFLMAIQSEPEKK